MKNKFIILLIAGTMIFPAFSVKAQSSSENKLNPRLASCLEQKMGSSVFVEIKAGTRKPTVPEKKSVEECFVKFGQNMMSGQEDKGKKNLDFSPETDSCLQQKLGPDYKTKLQNSKSRDEGEKIMSQAKDCFGDRGKRGDKELPDSVRVCVENTVGKAGAEKIFKGDKPINEIAEKNKLESAGCFAGFNRGKPKDGDRNLPEDKKKCIEGIIGSVQAQPSEAQKEEVGKKCFAEGKSGEQGEDHPWLSKDVEKCLQSSIGDNFKTKSPEKFSQDEREKANSCFSKNNFQPQGGKPGEKRPPMSEETSNCIARVSGKSVSARDFDDDTKGKIDKECFGSRGGPEGRKAINPKMTTESKSCEDRVVASIKEQLPPGEVEKRVNEQCYKGERFGEAPKNDDHSQPPSGGQYSPPNSGDEGRGIQSGSEERQRPNDETEDDGGKYCQENPAACQREKP